MSLKPIAPMLGAPHHVAYLVDDIAATVERLAGDLGAGPFVLLEDVPLENVESGGEAAEFNHDSAFGPCGGSPIELIQPSSLAPERVELRFAPPRPRVHHTAYVIAPSGVGGVRAALEERGVSQYLSSTLMGGPETTLHDASASFGHDLEIHADNEALRNFFGMVMASAEGWDGTEPLRPFEG